jgi:small subunit ribosomal protein S2
MAETTEAPVEAPAEAPATAPESETAKAIERKKLTVRDLVEAGCHFGHQTRRWNPRMKRFLFGERDGVHIIDLDQTLPRFEEALDLLRETVAGGGKVLFVSTKRQAQAPIEAEAKRASQYYVNRRWLGGMLTNFKTVKKSIDRYKELLELVGDEEKSGELSKKELSRVNRWIEKYSKSLDGIIEMTRLPDALFVMDVNREFIAVKEASRLGIPIIAIVDSNCDPDLIDLVVPGNDDSLRAIQLYCERAADACAEGAAVHNERVQQQVSEQEAKGGEKQPGGRVVVEIKQEPRRGRHTHSAAGREKPEGRGEHTPRTEGAGTPAPETPVPEAAAAPEAAVPETPSAE